MICSLSLIRTFLRFARFLLCGSLFGDLIFSSSGIGADSVDGESTENGQLFANSLCWSIWFSEYLFLERSWAKDERTLKQLQDFPLPFWLALFVEGTHFTQAKLETAQEYAASAGLSVPRNVLIPRTKGFVSAISEMRSFVPAIYEVTVAIPKSSPPPIMLRLFKGKSFVMHVHLKRHLMKDLPETDDAVAQWCRDMFVAKVHTLFFLINLLSFLLGFSSLFP
ncbi:1-acyl-sn-glycerol-3-phosphate acyltransferase 2 [Camellia lanceoleosa]|uniref:1-acyl-sn-glycerol-3-phosphate acyltransferase 2 n=1 Tax=Camellia lanceoleosa TaxID=1840588 RepID=A0ACC0G506_9ERIC|nr:1-acyl-sn-glycerol-3-phosphate acyltransferase 2 [Camellia lanceoleosa]